MRKVLILTAGFGEGHNAAARNIAAALDELAGEPCAEVADLFADASPRLNKVARRSYLEIINRTPRLWSAFYAWVDRSQVFPRHLWFLRKEKAALVARLKRGEHGVVCSTYPVYGFLAERLRCEGMLNVPFFNVVTDSISINRLWTRPVCSGWFVPNPETAREVVSLGVPASQVFDYGFPVQLAFHKFGQELAPPDLRGGARPRVLTMLHSGTQNAESIASRLISDTNWELTFAVGRDATLRNRLARLSLARKAPTTILSWTDQIPRLLLTHHIVISKAGGATTQEAIAAQCPMVVNQIVPGQEEGNYELLRQRNIGAQAESPEEVLCALEGAFADHGARWQLWRDALRPLARREAATHIAEHLLSVSSGGSLEFERPPSMQFSDHVIPSA